jgi:uncharacterized protein (UPF0147 family)
MTNEEMTNEELYQKAIDAINELFSDRSVPISECRTNLWALRSEIDTMLDALDSDEAI